MSQKNYRRHNCPISQSLSILGGQWTLLIARNLINGVNRFDDIQKNLQISRNLLTRRLKQMQKEGLTERVIPHGLRRAKYLPTNKCSDLINTLMALSEWAEKWMPDANRPRCIALKSNTKKPLKLALIPEEKAKKNSKNSYEMIFSDGETT